MALWPGFLAKPAQTPLTSRPSLTLFFLLTGAFLLTLVPHAIQFPPWVTVAVVAAMILRSVIEFYRLPLPSTTFCGIIAVVMAGAIFVQYGTLAGREAGTAFTACLLAIKFFELRRPRDVALIIFSCFFVVMSALLYSQVLELFVYCLIMMWILTALLLRVHTGDLPNDRLLRMLSQSGVIFLQALPLALVLFFFFPRYTGTLSLMLEGGTIGLNDTVSPGSISRLSQDDSEAMYVQFLTPNVPATTDSMYWRALVLWDYKNGTWTPGPLAAQEPRTKIHAAPGALVFPQEITVLAHNQRWLFALDTPVSAADNKADLPPATILDGDILQLQGGKLDHRARYDVTSSNNLEDEVISDDERSNGIQLPTDPKDHIDPQVVELADQLHQGIPDTQPLPYVFAVLKYFHHGGFVYSTAPGIQGPDWLPVFLFKTKTGFCEHFASAFAVLMRIEHIPTRLVVGYQGADYNPYSNLYGVSQSNAHAWDEVWIEAKKHWVRIDPTAILALAEEGLPVNQAADAQDTLSSQVTRHRETFSDAFLPAWAKDGLRQLQLRREQVETDWDNIVFSYDPDTQYRLAQALGFGEKTGFYLMLICIAAGGICLIVFKKWTMRKTPVSPVENLYAAFCRNMAQRGIPRAAWEGPFAYTERVAEAFPDDKRAIQSIGSIVASVRYGPAPADPAAPHQLKSLLTLLTASQAAATSRDRR
jgi:hypothetical protein